jgi:predicted AlkP superfamily phosphohydrolase/phosphomutase
MAFGGVAMAGEEQIVDAAIRDTHFEELRYQAMWLPKAARYIQKKYGWDLYYQHWHLPDILAHTFLAGLDPDSPFYSQGTEATRNALKEGYRIADEMLGAFLDMADENTYVIVVSDHGCTPDYNGLADIYQLLVDNGFLTHTEGEIDWSKTRAFSHGLTQIEINLKGRNPHGIVPPEEYEKVQEEIIDALYSWKDPNTGKRPIAFALKKKDAQLVGYWGPTTADVVCCYNGGFAIGLLQGQSIGPARDYGEHWCKLPTDRTGISSNLATFIIKGPGIRAGYKRDPERLGLMRLVDVVPTICHLMDFRPPAQSQGAVLWDMIE